MFYNCTNLTSAPELPATTLSTSCYAGMFYNCTNLTSAPELPATTLADYCYTAMFANCTSLTSAPKLPAITLAQYCYRNMFYGCSSLNYIRCYATNISATYCTTDWVYGVAATGTFVKDPSMTSWTTGNNGIPTNWEIINSTVQNISLTTWTYNNNTITTPYSVNQTDGHSSSYAKGTFNFETNVDYLEKQPTYLWFQHADQSAAIYVNDTLVEKHWGGYTPFFVDITDVIHDGTNNIKVALKNNEGNNLAPAEGDFNFNATLGNVKLLSSPYLPAMKYGYDGFHVTSTVTDASATVNIKTAIPSGANITCKIVDNLAVNTWSGNTENLDNHLNVYVTKNYIKTGDVVTVKGTNIRVHNNQTVINTVGNFTYTFTYTEPITDTESHYVHVPSSLVGGITDFYIYVDYSSNGKFSPLRCTIEEGRVSGINYCIGTMEVSMIGPKTIYSETQPSIGDEQTFTTTISNPHLWNGKSDPFLYHITLDIIKDGITLQSYTRDYGLRYYEYVINDSTVVQGETYTGFLLNGQPYQLRGVCMHDDLAGKANALNDTDYTQEFAILQELNCNFIRLAHYPHPKEVYDKCDQLGIIVQTEAPCVNKLQSTMPTAYYEHLDGQYTDMVNQHFNHPCIMFWGLSNETKTDDADFGKTKIEHYVSLIKSIDTERLVGYVMSHSTDNPSLYYNDPSNVDWFGCNIYVGWYIDQNSNDPTNRLNTRLNNTLTRLSKPMAFSEYGCGGTQHCHSETPQTTTTRGNYERHDIEYQMWLHEGHLAAIRNFPQLLFTAQWQLFDIAVSKRNEGYTVCLDGETATTDDNLRYLNNKGLVERDHTTKKDTFYLYKAEWNSTQLFVHICGKDYTKKTDRKIKCYTNDGNQLSLYIGNSQTPIETVTVTNHIAEFSATNFLSGDVVRVVGATTEDTFTFE
jgi:beta-galactosidase